MPSYTYNKQRMDQVIELCEDEELAKTYMQHVEAAGKEIETYLTKSEKFYPSVLNCTQRIRNGAEDIAKLCSCGTLRATTRMILLAGIEELEQDIDDLLAMSAAEQQLEQKHVLEMCKQQTEGSASRLQGMKQRMLALEVDKFAMPSCYFSYAWPVSKHAERESWVQPFLEKLSIELKTAGLRVVMDTQSLRPGGNLHTFMRESASTTKVCVFGTRSLLTKHRDPKSSGVQVEMSHVVGRKGRGVIPILLSGPSSRSLPEFVRTPSICLAQCKDYEAFFSALMNLLLLPNDA